MPVIADSAGNVFAQVAYERAASIRGNLVGRSTQAIGAMR